MEIIDLLCDTDRLEFDLIFLRLKFERVFRCDSNSNSELSFDLFIDFIWQIKKKYNTVVRLTLKLTIALIIINCTNNLYPIM